MHSLWSRSLLLPCAADQFLLSQGPQLHRRSRVQGLFVKPLYQIKCVGLDLANEVPEAQLHDLQNKARQSASDVHMETDNELWERIICLMEKKVEVLM